MFYDIRSERPHLDFKIVNFIHDAGLFEVKDEHVNEFANEVVPFCMSQRVPIPNTGGKRLGSDLEIGNRWSGE